LKKAIIKTRQFFQALTLGIEVKPIEKANYLRIKKLFVLPLIKNRTRVEFIDSLI
jgi:hypothetical protein